MNEEALCSILCGEERWLLDAESNFIRFHQDNTGEVYISPYYIHQMIADDLES
jgi:hypothetical protein